MTYHISIMQKMNPSTPALKTPTDFLKQIKDKDVSTFILLYDTHSRLVFALFFSIFSDFVQAREFLFQFFSNLWQKPHLFEDSIEANTQTWLILHARRKAIAHLHSPDYKRKKNKPRFSIKDIPADQSSEQLTHLRNAIKELTHNEQITLEQSYFQGWTVHEIARKQNMTDDEVKRTLSSALKRLQSAARSKEDF